jgi:hypothetical protein
MAEVQRTRSTWRSRPACLISAAWFLRFRFRCPCISDYGTVLRKGSGYRRSECSCLERAGWSEEQLVGHSPPTCCVLGSSILRLASTVFAVTASWLHVILRLSVSSRPDSPPHMLHSTSTCPAVDPVQSLLYLDRPEREAECPDRMCCVVSLSRHSFVSPFETDCPN